MNAAVGQKFRKETNMTDQEYHERTVKLLSSIQANINCLTWVIVGSIILAVVMGGCTVVVPMVF